MFETQYDLLFLVNKLILLVMMGEIKNVKDLMIAAIQKLPWESKLISGYR